MLVGLHRATWAGGQVGSGARDAEEVGRERGLYPGLTWCPFLFSSRLFVPYGVYRFLGGFWLSYNLCLV